MRGRWRPWSDQRIHQRRFAGIGRADDGGKAGRVVFSGPSVIRSSRGSVARARRLLGGALGGALAVLRRQIFSTVTVTLESAAMIGPFTAITHSAASASHEPAPILQRRSWQSWGT